MHIESRCWTVWGLLIFRDENLSWWLNEQLVSSSTTLSKMIRSCFKIGEMFLEMLISFGFMCKHADGTPCEVKASAPCATYYCCMQQ